MLRYRIIRNPKGHYVVLAASLLVVPIAETYATRAEAQDTADWLNRLGANEFESTSSGVCVL